MSLKARLTADEHAALTSEAIQALYTKSGDVYVLDAEGVEDVGGLKTALETERKARKAAEDAAKAEAKKYEGVDVDAYKKWVADAETNAEAKLIKEGKIDEVIKQRTEKMRRDHEAEVASLRQENQTLKDQAGKLQSDLADNILGAAIATAGPKAGVRASALPDLTTRARGVFKFEDGKLVPYKDGSIYYGKTGGKPIDVDEWIATLTTDAPHLFETNKGTDTPADRGRQVGGAMRLTREQARDPHTYRTTKEQAEKAGLQLEIVEN